MTAPALGADARGFDLAEREERELGPASPYPARKGGIRGGPGPPDPGGGSTEGPSVDRAALPGRGPYGPGCGSKVPLGLLAADGCLPLVYHRCHDRTCPRPDCGGQHRADAPPGDPAYCDLELTHGGGTWAHEAALAVAIKLQAYAASKGIRVLRQVVVSPPTDRYPETGSHGKMVRGVRGATHRALTTLAWGGEPWGSLLIHPWGGCEEVGYNEWRPHAHNVGPGIDTRRTEAYWRRTGGRYWMNPEVRDDPVLDELGKPLIRRQGVVVKQVNNKSGWYAGYWGRKLVRHLVYEFGHCAVLPGGHAASYAGKDFIRYAPKYDEPEPSGEPPPRKCSHGEEFRPLGYGQHPRFDPETRGWTFRGPPGESYVFTDRAPAEGGPILERITERGGLAPVAIAPYIADELPRIEDRYKQAKLGPGPPESEFDGDTSSDCQPERSPGLEIPSPSAGPVDPGYAPGDSPEQIEAAWAGLHAEIERLERQRDTAETPLTDAAFLRDSRPVRPLVPPREAARAMREELDRLDREGR